MSLCVAGGQLWKQHVDRIERWHDVAHDQGGAEVISESRFLAAMLRQMRQ